MALNRVVICGVNTSKLPNLSEQEKNELFDRIDQGDSDARRQFIEGNLRLVLSVIQRFGNAGENPDDLFQVGCIGLIKALDNFDRSLNVKFSTYAVPMILGECRRYLRDNNSIRVSRSLRDIAYKAIYAKENLQKTKDKEPTIEEIAKEICIPAEDILMSLDAISAPLSLYEPVFQEGGDTLYIMDQIKDAKCKEDLWVNNLDLQDGLDRLCDRERAIINLRFFEGRTQMEVAEKVGISQAQVSRLEKNAIKYLKKYLKEENG
jgi:RNA polymerase sporulation-specific sigma factor